MTAVREKVKLISTAKTQDGKKTGTFYTTTVNKRARASTGKGKMEIKKFDRRAMNEKTGKLGAHVLFKEDKIK
jgi:ribosomal protein L33